MTHTRLSVFYSILLAIAASAGALFAIGPVGFTAQTPDGPFFCAKLQSSGSDDDAMMLLYLFFAVPAFIRLIRMRNLVGRVEIVCYLAAVGLALTALWLAQLDCAEPLFTAFVLRSPALLTAIAAAALSIPLFLRLLRFS